VALGGRLKEVIPVRYKLVIFDLDGTLSNSFPWFLDNVNDVAARFGFRSIGAGEVEALRAAGTREILKRLQVPRWKLPFIARHMRRLKTERGGSIALFPGVGPMLSALHEAGVATAMVSSDHEPNVRRTLRDNASLIHHYACGAALFGKAAKFKRAMRIAGAGPNETIAIGDELRDIDAARKVQIAFGAVAWGYANPDALRARNPEHFFTSMDEIAQRLT